jgi:Lipase (class 3)
MDAIDCLLAVAADIAYMQESRSGSSKERIESAKKVMSEQYPSMKLNEYKVIKSNYDMYAMRNEKTNQIIIAYRGTAGEHGLRDFINDVALALCAPHRNLQAKAFANDIISKYPNSNILITGHSLGGTLAEFVTKDLNIKYGYEKIKCSSFNAGSSGITGLLGKIINWSFTNPKTHKSTGLLSDLRENLQSNLAPSNIKSFYVPGDLFSLNPLYGRRIPIKDQIYSLNPLRNHSLDRFLEHASNIEKSMRFVDRIPGGVDFSGIPSIAEDFRESEHIIGFSIDEDSCYFISKGKGDHYNLDSGILLKDLAVALMVNYSEKIESKGIVFSLDPYEETNPSGPFMRKVHWPDCYHNFPIVAGTELGKVLFECDYIMKQLSLDTKSTTDPSPLISPRLRALGLKASHEFVNFSEACRWSRYWLVIEEVHLEKFSEGINKILQFKNVKIGVRARMMEINAEGILEDKISQDFNNGIFQFANKFTEIYDEIAVEFPVFNRLKQVAKAITLANWLKINNIPVDFNKVQSFVESNRDIHYQTKIDSINRTIITKNGNQTIEKRIFGGTETVIKNPYALLEPENIPKYKNISTESSQVIVKPTNARPKNITLKNFLFNLVQKCIECQTTLSVQEQTNCLKDPYCSIHNPDLCNVCLSSISGLYIVVQGKKVHSDCFTCNFCGQKISGQFSTMEILFLHPECAQCVNDHLQDNNNQISSIDADADEIRMILEEKFSLDTCKNMLKKHNGNKESAINELLKNIPTTYQKTTKKEQPKTQTSTTKMPKNLSASVKNELEFLISMGFDENLVIEIYLNTCCPTKTRNILLNDF